jgi:hypothetical protein
VIQSAVSLDVAAFLMSRWVVTEGMFRKSMSRLSLTKFRVALMTTWSVNSTVLDDQSETPRFVKT